MTATWCDRCHRNDVGVLRSYVVEDERSSVIMVLCDSCSMALAEGAHDVRRWDVGGR